MHRLALLVQGLLGAPIESGQRWGSDAVEQQCKL